jgi:hypothetical protein
LHPDAQSPTSTCPSPHQVLYVEALRRGFAAAGRPCRVANMSALLADPTCLPPPDTPLIVLGYMKQLGPCLSLDDAGRLHLLGRQVHGVVNDRFVLNIVQQFEATVNLEELATFNRCVRWVVAVVAVALVLVAVVMAIAVDIPLSNSNTLICHSAIRPFRHCQQAPDACAAVTDSWRHAAAMPAGALPQAPTRASRTSCTTAGAWRLARVAPRPTCLATSSLATLAALRSCWTWCMPGWAKGSRRSSSRRAQVGAAGRVAVGLALECMPACVPCAASAMCRGAAFLRSPL